MPENLALQIQRLGGLADQVLVVAHVAQLQGDLASCTPNAVKRCFVALRIPPPANVSEYLNRLARNKLVLRVRPGEWSLTPEGLDTIRRLMVGVLPGALRDLGTPVSEPLFADAPHHLIPPQLAPSSFQSGIGRFLQGHPFETNVFCMTRFPRSDTDAVGAAINACRDALSDFGLELHLASDRTVMDLLFGNVAAAMWASRLGIAIFEDMVGKGLNHNVMLEVGGMLVTGRRCLLLRDVAIDLPTDLVGHIYKKAKIADPADVKRAVREWIEEIR